MSESLRDLVVSLSLDSDNFSRNLTSINRQIQEAESEFKRAASGVDGFEKSVAGCEAKLSTLQQKLSLQQKAVQQYEKALAAAEKKLQNSYDKHGKLNEALDTARQKNTDLKDKVAAATDQYERFPPGAWRGQFRHHRGQGKPGRAQRRIRGILPRGQKVGRPAGRESAGHAE